MTDVADRVGAYRKILDPAAKLRNADLVGFLPGSAPRFALLPDAVTKDPSLWNSPRGQIWKQDNALAGRHPRNVEGRRRSALGGRWCVVPARHAHRTIQPGVHEIVCDRRPAGSTLSAPTSTVRRRPIRCRPDGADTSFPPATVQTPPICSRSRSCQYRQVLGHERETFQACRWGSTPPRVGPSSWTPWPRSEKPGVRRWSAPSGLS